VIAIDRADDALLEAVDRALADGARRARAHLACRPGCTECCIGPFPISRLDALRLARGRARLAACDRVRAAELLARARSAWARLRVGFPGDPASGRIGSEPAAEMAFLERHARLPCPALDPDSGLCDLYPWRPLTCRTSGPPLRLAGTDLEPCRLCFVGAAPSEVEASRVEPDPGGLEDALLDRLEAEQGPGWETVVAFVLGACRAEAG